MKTGKKGSAAAVLVAPAAVGACAAKIKKKPAGKHAASATDDGGAAVGAFAEQSDYGAAVSKIPEESTAAEANERAKRPKDDLDGNGRVVKVRKTARQRHPRVWFLGLKFAVTEGQEEAAKAALKNARNAEEVWTEKAWKTAMKTVLKPFRVGVSHGGARFNKTSSPDVVDGRTPGLARAAVGAVPGAVTPSAKDQPSPTLTGSPLGSIAEYDLPGLPAFRNKLRVRHVSKFLGGGSYGKVYEMTASSYSAVGEPPMQVAVKVLPKLVFTKKNAVEFDGYVAQEINILTLLADAPGIVQLLSWTEGLFDVHLAFPIYTCCLHDFIQRGDLKLVSKGQPDIMPGICKQLLLALHHVHGLKIVHRDLKPANILVDDDMFSAVGETKGPKVVLADFGGACQLQVSATTAASFTVLKGGRDVTTYQFRAPELFVRAAFRACSYATDVWAMGVTVVTMDLGDVPFGREKMMRSNMDEIFIQQLKVLFKTKVDAFDDAVRKDPEAFNKKLAGCKLLESHALPWGRSRSVSFQNFMRRFFTPFPASRPLAGTLARDQVLPN